MTGPVRHEEIEELLGVYALDAVDEAERALVDEHLLACPKCRAELAQHREVTATLAHSGATAPEGIWARIEAALEEPPPPMRVELRPLGELDGARQYLPLGSAQSPPSDAAPVEPAYPDNVVVLPRRRQVALRIVATAAVLAAFAVIGGLVVQTLNQRDQIDAAREEVSLADQALDALGDGSSRSTLLRSEDDLLQARAVVSEDGDGFIFANDLPALDGQVYQLWGVTPGRTVSLGVLGAAPELKSFSSYEGVTALMITIEDSPGVEESANDPALVGSLT